MNNFVNSELAVSELLSGVNKSSPSFPRWRNKVFRMETNPSIANFFIWKTYSSDIFCTTLNLLRHSFMLFWCHVGAGFASHSCVFWSKMLDSKGQFRGSKQYVCWEVLSSLRKRRKSNYVKCLVCRSLLLSLEIGLRVPICCIKTQLNETDPSQL